MERMTNEREGLLARLAPSSPWPPPTERQLCGAYIAGVLTVEDLDAALSLLHGTSAPATGSAPADPCINAELDSAKDRDSESAYSATEETHE